VDALEIRIFEPVAVKRDGVPVDRSPFSGNTHPLDEVIEQIGKEATRFFLLATPLDRPLDLDLGVAARGGVANPLQRLLGAHRQARELSNTGADAGLSDRIRSLDHPAAAPLMHALLEYPGRLAAATESRDPARLIQYLQHLAAAWEPLTSEPEPAATLGAPVAVVLENALRTLGLSTGA
jgi:arginyl-tRNA synthetase